jgi:hypothetical protein
MADPLPNPDLMRSLGRLVRGLSSLFWGLPAALVICFHTARAEVLRPFEFIPPLAATGLLVYGLWQLDSFQRQERIWRNALDRARVLSLVNFGLSPFLYWSNKVPGNGFFYVMLLLMMATGFLFLGSVNVVLQRLGAMLPDEGLQQETRQFTAFNLNLLWISLLLAAAYLAIGQMPVPPAYLREIFLLFDRIGFWLMIPLVLLPLAMTMALLWKTKEVILDNVFGFKPPSL